MLHIPKQPLKTACAECKYHLVYIGVPYVCELIKNPVPICMLQEFMYPPRSILGRPFEMWAPSLLPLPPPVTASRKTIADVVEALLG